MIAVIRFALSGDDDNQDNDYDAVAEEAINDAAVDREEGGGETRGKSFNISDIGDISVYQAQHLRRQCVEELPYRCPRRSSPRPSWEEEEEEVL